jgi:RNA polymerase II-associated factor 1
MSSFNRSAAQNKGTGHKSNIQYVAKVRYSNNLPPPSCPPKLLKDDKEKSNNAELTTLVSSFFRKENFKNLIKLNDDLGMPINLINIPQKDTIYGLKNNGLNLELHPSDQLLLADPSKNIKTKSETVSFLRRTQYISSDIQNNLNPKNINKLKVKKDDELDPKTQLKAIEDMFESPNLGLSSFKHPTKKHLKVKKVWNFLPDTSMLDQSYYDIKFMSSASISKNKDKSKDSIKSITDPRLLTAIFREIELNKNTRLVSFYLTDNEDAEKIKNKIDDETENAPIDDNEIDEILNDETKKSIYKKQRDYDGSIKSIDPLRQLVITFDEKSNNAYYIPISGKMELKKCRIDPYLLPKIKELTYDQINMFIREPTNSEIENRDILRSTYDPMEFGADDE